MIERFDHIIIGGGMAGLSAGALLSSDGARVLLIEKRGLLGGRCFILQKDGWTFDNGIHLVRFGPSSALSIILRKLGFRLSFVPLGSSFVEDIDGTIKLFPTSPSGFIKSGLFSFAEKMKVLSLMWKMKQKGLDLEEMENFSVSSFLERNKIKGGLGRYFHLVSGSILVCPFIERASAGELLKNIRKVLITGHSAEYPEDGWLPIISRLREEIERRGKILLKKRVDSLIIDKEKVLGVTCKEEEFRAEKVIYAAPLQLLPSILPETAPYYREIEEKTKLKPTAGVVLDYGLKGSISDSTGLWYKWKPMGFGLFTSNLCPSLAPTGHQILTWFRPIPVEAAKSGGTAVSLLKETESSLMELFPAMRDAIIFRRARVLTMVDGVEINVEQTEGKRPGPLMEPLENFYVTGDSTDAPGAGGDVCYESVLKLYRYLK